MDLDAERERVGALVTLADVGELLLIMGDTSGDPDMRDTGEKAGSTRLFLERGRLSISGRPAGMPCAERQLEMTELVLILLGPGTDTGD